MKYFLPFLLLTAGLSVNAAQVTLANAGSLVHDNIYIGPYSLGVDANATSAATANYTYYSALCVDYADESHIGDKWSANLTSASMGSASSTYTQNVTAYAEAAYLFGFIVQPGVTGQQRIDIQEAVWSLTNSSYTPDSAGASQYVTDAQQNWGSLVASGYYNNFEVVSDTNTGSGREQEFLIDPNGPPTTASFTPTPEPATFALLGGTLLLAGASRRFIKR